MTLDVIGKEGPWNSRISEIEKMDIKTLRNTPDASFPIRIGRTSCDVVVLAQTQFVETFSLDLVH